MATKQISLRLDEELIYQIKERAFKSRMTQYDLTKMWIIKSLSEPEESFSNNP